MIEAGDLKRGTTLRIDGTLYRVVNTAYQKPGRGTASMRATLLDIRSGNTSQRVFPAGDRLDNLFVEAEDVEYLYRDGDMLHFMNTNTYDQYETSVSLFGDDVQFLRDGMGLKLKIYEGSAIDYELPTTVVYKVVDSEVAVVGNSAGNVTKKVVVDSGASVTVPIFINVGEEIKVDTRDGSYIGRG